MKNIIVPLVIIFIGLLGYRLYTDNIMKNRGGLKLISAEEYLKTPSSGRDGIIHYTSDSWKKMTDVEALFIAKNSECNMVGEFTGKSSYNKNNGGFISLSMSTNKKGCRVRCDVSIDNKTAKTGWMCTGLQKPTKESREKYNSFPVSDF